MSTEINDGLPNLKADSKPGKEHEQNKLTNAEVFSRIEELMHDKSFLIDVASSADEAYRKSEIDRLTIAGQPIEDWLSAPLLSDLERTVLISGAAEGNSEQQAIHDKAQQKLAMGLAGFYAVSAGLGMAAETSPKNPTQAQDTLAAVIAGTETEGVRNMMSRLAHATWAAGQPFRGRETRPVMKPYDNLSPEEQHKDMVQIRASASALSARLISPVAPTINA